MKVNTGMSVAINVIGVRQTSFCIEGQRHRPRDGSLGGFMYGTATRNSYQIEGFRLTNGNSNWKTIKSLICKVASVIRQNSCVRGVTVTACLLMAFLVLTETSEAASRDFRAATRKLEAPVVLPACVNNPQAFIIRSIADWARINDPNYSVFCVVPGDYSKTSSGTGPSIMLTADGTAAKRRWLRWFDPANPNDTTTHPAKMPANKRATVRQLFFGIGEATDPGKRDPANYWTVDRIAINGATSGFDAGSSHNVLNRALIENVATHSLAFFSSDDNVLQNSVLRNSVPKPHTDAALIFLRNNARARIINNELYNATASGIQIWHAVTSSQLIAGNEIYVTPDRYTNCQGRFDRLGLCACSEIGIALKGPRDPSASVRIENNLLSGFRPTDTACAGTGSPGDAIDLGAGGTVVDRVVIQDNYIFDTSQGVYVGLKVSNVDLKGNVFYRVSTAKHDGVAISNGFGKNFNIVNNRIIDADVWFSTTQLATNTSVDCNVVITGKSFSSAALYSSSVRFDSNYLFQSGSIPSQLSGNNYSFSSPADSKAKQVCLDTHQMTDRKALCIPYAEGTPTSPESSCTASKL